MSLLFSPGTRYLCGGMPRTLGLHCKELVCQQRMWPCLGTHPKPRFHTLQSSERKSITHSASLSICIVIKGDSTQQRDVRAGVGRAGRGAVLLPIINTELQGLPSELTRWASLVAQWLRMPLPMQGTRVRALAWEDPTCHGATKPVHHNY